MSEDILVDYWAERDKRSKQIRESKLPLLEELKESGVTRAVVSYEGSGDSGEIQDTSSFKDNADFPIDVGLRTKIEEYVYGMLESEFGGWEINEGSFGEVTFLPGPRKITYVHNQRVEQIETSEGKW